MCVVSHGSLAMSRRSLFFVCLFFLLPNTRSWESEGAFGGVLSKHHANPRSWFGRVSGNGCTGKERKGRPNLRMSTRGTLFQHV